MMNASSFPSTCCTESLTDWHVASLHMQAEEQDEQDLQEALDFEFELELGLFVNRMDYHYFQSQPPFFCEEEEDMGHRFC